MHLRVGKLNAALGAAWIHISIQPGLQPLILQIFLKSWSAVLNIRMTWKVVLKHNLSNASAHPRSHPSLGTKLWIWHWTVGVSQNYLRHLKAISVCGEMNPRQPWIETRKTRGRLFICLHYFLVTDLPELKNLLHINSAHKILLMLLWYIVKGRKPHLPVCAVLDCTDWNFLINFCGCEKLHNWSRIHDVPPRELISSLKYTWTIILHL